MRKAAAFTLIELLVVIGIIAILVGLLLPALTHMRRSAQVTAQKAEFQTISTALEQYKEDFGDYPRNADLKSWPVGGNAPAPVFMSLATALLGPGPAVTNSSQLGDGNDGLGFRASIADRVPGTASISAGQTTLTFTPDSPTSSQYLIVTGKFVSTSQTPTAITFIESAATTTKYSETLGIATFTPLATSSPAAYSHSGRAFLFVPSGKVWGPYLSADSFKTTTIPIGFPGAGQPLLLDAFGQVIQYFPRYGTAGNNVSDSTYASTFAAKSVTAGPLIGYSQPYSLDKTDGQNAIWDFRDGAPFLTSASSGAVSQAWAPVSTAGSYFDPTPTMQWMLGDNAANGSNNGFSNVIMGGDKLNFDGPFILISAGPDGPNRANGGYCNFLNVTSGTLTDAGGNPLAASERNQAFINSGNVYNFDHP